MHLSRDKRIASQEKYICHVTNVLRSGDLKMLHRPRFDSTSKPPKWINSTYARVQCATKCSTPRNTTMEQLQPVSYVTKLLRCAAYVCRVINLLQYIIRREKDTFITWQTYCTAVMHKRGIRLSRDRGTAAQLCMRGRYVCHGTNLLQCSSA